MRGARSTRVVLAALLLAAGCQREPAAIVRPPAPEPFEAVTVADTTMPARRFALGPPHVLALGALPAGELLVSAAVEGPAGARAVLSLDGAPDACAVDAPGGWVRCRFPIGRARDDLRLSVHGQGPAEARVAVSAPVVRSGPPSRSLVLVILIDTVRFDRLQTYEPAVPLGAGIDRLARDGIVFERAHSSSSWTRTAVATLFTGLDASTHHVLGRDDLLPASLDGLPALMQRTGRRTVAWSTNPNILPLWGFDRGFDAFHDVGARSWPTVKVHAPAVLAAVQAALDDGEPLPAFWYVHLMDAHAPYRPDEADLTAVMGDARLTASFPGAAAPPALHAEYARYLAEIRGMDRALDAFFDALRARGLYEDATILVVSDHGEEFHDHGGTRHGKTLYEEVLRVPVVLKLAGNRLAGTRVADPIGLADVAPTLLALLGIDGLGVTDGRSLWHPDAGRLGAEPAPRTAVLKLDTHHQAAMLDGSRKLILDFQADASRLFDLVEDPGERRDLLPGAAPEAATLRARLDARLARHGAGWHVRICGGDRPARVRLRVVVTGPLGTTALEAEDAVRPAEGGWDVAVALDPRPSERVVDARVWKGLAPDEDEVVAGADADRLVVTAADGTALAWATGRSEATTTAPELAVAAADPTVRVRPSDPVECRPSVWRRSADTELHPYVRVWYVAPPERHGGPVDPALEERLRSLGYAQ